ncbi:hypothetical protein GOODEAATRI_018795, partial [Goodea atripinnis]
GFTAAELSPAFTKMKSSKSPCRDNINPEFDIHQYYQRTKLLKTQHHASITALPKLHKLTKALKSYRSISLLCVPCRIMERLIHSPIEPVVDPQPPPEQPSASL